MNHIREILIKTIPVLDNPEFNEVQISIYYSKGGMNWFSGASQLRGYYLGIAPVSRNGRTLTYKAFTGTRYLLEEASRFNRKHLESLVTTVPEGLIENLLERVLSDNKIVL